MLFGEKGELFHGAAQDTQVHEHKSGVQLFRHRRLSFSEDLLERVLALSEALQPGQTSSSHYLGVHIAWSHPDEAIEELVRLPEAPGTAERVSVREGIVI